MDRGAIPIFEKPILAHPWLVSEVDPIAFAPYHAQAHLAAVEFLKVAAAERWPDVSKEDATIFAVGPAVIGEPDVRFIDLYIHLPGISGVGAEKPAGGMNPYAGTGLLPVVITTGNFSLLNTRRMMQFNVATAGLHIAGPEYKWPEPLPEDPKELVRIRHPQFYAQLLEEGGVTSVMEQVTVEFFNTHPRRILGWLMDLVMVEQKQFSQSPAHQAALIAEHYGPLNEYALLADLLKEIQQSVIRVTTEGEYFTKSRIILRAALAELKELLSE